MSIRAAKAFEPYHPLFLEEPRLHENVDTMATVARSTFIPIATGERLMMKWDFREVLEKQPSSSQTSLTQEGSWSAVRPRR